jgi:hypothetical protein
MPTAAPFNGGDPDERGPGARALLPLLETALFGTGNLTAPRFEGGVPGVQGAIVLDARDTGKARAFLAQRAARAGAQATSYHGVAFQATKVGLAFGVVGRFAVIGSEQALRSLIDTHRFGGSLASLPLYSRLTKKAPADRIAHVFVRPPREAPHLPAEPLGLFSGERVAEVSVVEKARSVSLYSDTEPSPNVPTGNAPGLLSSGEEASRAFAGLPGESWLALGLPRLATSLDADVSGLRELVTLLGASEEGGSAPTGLSVGAILKGLLAPIAALAKESSASHGALTRWMGPGGLFASGAGLLELHGAIVIESSEPASSRAAVGRLGQALRAAGYGTEPVAIPGTDAALGVRVPGVPVVLDVADGRDSSGRTKFVVGLGEGSVTAALNPPSTMAGASSRAAAAGTLGEGLTPTVLLQTPTFVGLLEGVGLAEGPGFARTLPTLRALGTIVGGGRSLGGQTERFKLVLGLQNR